MPEHGSFISRAREFTAGLLPARGYRVVRGAWRQLHLFLPHGLMVRSIPGIPGRVHVEDGMLRDYSAAAAGDYAALGREALRHMDHALALAGRSWEDVRDLLDYGGGYGRVLRWVRAEHPTVRSTIAELNVQAARFAAREFGAEAIIVNPRHVVPSFPRTYDLVWVGSVLTHLDERDGLTLLNALAAALRPGGLLLFTSHGTLIPDRLPTYGVDVSARADEIAATLAAGRNFFLPGIPGHRYPLTFHAPDGMRALVALVQPPIRIMAHASRGWDDHQDVWSCQRS